MYTFKIVMLSVRQSTIAGRGAFAASLITKHAIVWTSDADGVEYFTLDQLIQKNDRDLAEHVFWSTSRQLFVFAADDTVYINHSQVPNCVTIDQIDKAITTIALVDIYPGTELVEDYSTFDDNAQTQELFAHYAIQTVS